MNSPAPGLGSIFLSVLEEVKRRMLSVAVLFFVFACVGLGVGLLLPKTWECSALLVPDTGSVKPLMEGRGSGNNENQLTRMIRTVQTRKILHEVLEFGGWLDRKVSAQEEERLLAKLHRQLRLDGGHDGMIRISYRDSDPKRTFAITNKMVDIMIREAANARETSSREAYEFVDRQVKEYSSELAEVHEKLLTCYRSQGAAAPTIPSDGSNPEASEPRRDGRALAGRLSSEDLVRLRAEEATLAAQLAHPVSAMPGPVESARAEERLRSRVEQLRFEYDHLVNTYTGQHPDVVRKGNELESTRQDLRQLETARLDNEKARAATAALDEQVARAARARLEEVRELLSASSGGSGRAGHRRPSTTPVAAPVGEPTLVDPEMQRIGQDSKLAELLRRYETTREVYQDLLKKREMARLSLNLEVERSNVVLKVHEPPTMPVIASGMRVMHKTIVGLVVAAAVPLLALVALVSLDGRVRSVEQLARLSRLPVLVAIPHAATAPRRERLRRALALLLVVAVFALYLVVFLISRSRVPL